MILRQKHFFCWILFLVLFNTLALSQEKTKIACVGDSITYGAGVANREKNSYPAKLQQYLGEQFLVKNFGLGGSTILSLGNKPYIQHEEYRQSLAFDADILFIKLGTNDSKGINAPHYAHLKSDFHALAESYKKDNPQLRVILVKPVRNYYDSPDIFSDKRLREHINTALEAVAYEGGYELIDAHSFFSSSFDAPLMPDKVHPSSLGAAIMAQQFDRYLRMPRDRDFDIFEKLQGGKDFNFHGFQGKDFVENGVNYKVVAPKIANEKHTWVMRARFWGHEPQFDIKMLELGYHIVYCDVADLYGSQEALNRWDSCYKKMTDAGLSKRLVLEGMSRGGLIIYRWAAKNPEKVSAIYGDAPVMDIKSWPMGEGAAKGSAHDTQLLLKAYGAKSKEELLRHAENPVDAAQVIAEAKIPIIHVVGAADKVVPVAENTALFQKRLQQHGGKMTLISKEGVGHHPHSLSMPEPLVRFVLRADGIEYNYATQPITGGEYRAGAGWTQGSDWHAVADDITQAVSKKEVDLLLLGDSITQWFSSPDRKRTTTRRDFSKSLAGIRIESAGISGDRTQNLLWRIKNGRYNACKPRYVSIAIGVNNLVSGKDDAQSVYQGIIAVTEAALKEFPQAEILLFGLLPTAASDDALQAYRDIHAELSRTSFDARVRYIDPSPHFLGSDGRPRKELYSPDMIHLQAAGYDVWAALLRKLIKE